jgi:hypothetical protein
MKKLLLLSLFLSPLFLLYSQTHAEVPQMINYQGKLTTAEGGCLNDTVQMVFSVYPDSFGTTADWTETQDSVVVKEGIFSVLLGSVDSIPTSLFDGSVKYLGVQVESDPEMRPLKPMVSVPYAYRAVTVDGNGAGSGWVDDGAVVRLETGTDRVGIGDTAPDDAKLCLDVCHVRGRSKGRKRCQHSPCRNWYVGRRGARGSSRIRRLYRNTWPGILRRLL